MIVVEMSNNSSMDNGSRGEEDPEQASARQHGQFPEEVYSRAMNDEHFIHMRGGWCYWALEPYPLVYNLWVVPECRGQGYGRKLLRMAVAEIRASVGNERKIKVQAIQFDKGIYKSRLKRFYRSEGLVVMEKEEQ